MVLNDTVHVLWYRMVPHYGTMHVLWYRMGPYYGTE